MLAKHKRQTSVIWSLESHALTDKLIDTAMEERADALRLVTSRGRVEQTIEFIKKLKSSSHEWAGHLPILVDLCSYPRGVLVNLKDSRELSFGDQVTFVKAGQKGGDFEVESDEWPDLFAVDHSVYLSAGMVVLKPMDVNQDKVTLQVVQGGFVRPNADLQVPFTHQAMTMESIPEESWALCEQEHVDYVIVPSMDSAVELEKVKDRLHASGNKPWLLLKVGTKATYDKLDQLLPMVRGVLVSRVELSMDTDPAQVPMMTKEMIQKCNQHSCMVLVASEMLGSMRDNATPTRAEVSDMANAVFDGADGVVLSEALADGQYLERGFELTKRCIEDVEASAMEFPLNWIKRLPAITNEIEAVTYASYRAAHRNQAKAVVCMTKAGNTAFHLRSFGVNVPIISLSTSPEVIRRLRIVKGVEGMTLDSLPSIDDVLPLINNLMINMEWFAPGEKYVFVSITLSSVGEEGSNMFTVQTISS
jgi:pyruvate kinase